MDNFCDKCHPGKQCSTCMFNGFMQKIEDVIQDFKVKTEQEFNTFNTEYSNQQEATTSARDLIEEEHDNIPNDMIEEEYDNIPSFTKLVETKDLTCLIHAPTQVGKTKASKDIIQVCVDKGIHVIMSCDNKTDQRKQLESRLRSEFVFQDDVEIIMADSANLQKKVTDGIKQSKNLVILCLDNWNQIYKTKQAFKMAIGGEKLRLDTLMVIHDEADMTVKNDDVINTGNDQAKSHRQWIEFVNYFKDNGVELKRVFVTATPEVIVTKYGIKHVVNLRVPNNYTGYDKINRESIGDKAYADTLIKEQKKIHDSGKGGVILFCTERKIGKGQDPIFVESCKKLECTVSIYNGTGITVRPEKPEAFKEYLDRFAFRDRNDEGKKKLEYRDKSTNKTDNVLLIKNLKINDFYKICLDSGNKVVVTIGMDLMARGISFVSSKPTPDEERSGRIIPEPLCAISMIYKPGKTQTAVNINQIIGRLTGTVRPDLQRTLFAPQSVIDTYVNYNENQKQILKEISENSGIVTTKIMADMELLYKLEHQLERQKVKCYIKTRKQDLEVDIHDLTHEENERMEEFVEKWNNETSITGKIFRYIKQERIVSREKLVTFVKDLGAADCWYGNIGKTSQVYKHFNLVFIRKQDGSTTLRQEVFDFFDNSEKQGR